MIPIEADVKERDQMMEDQVYYWLERVCSYLGAFEPGVKMVQAWLKQFCQAHPARKPWVEAAANKAGERYLKKIKGDNKQTIKIPINSLFNKLFGG